LLVSTIQSVERAFAILRALAAAPAGVSELAALVELPKSTVARMLATLERIGAVERDEDGPGYRIGQAVGELAGAIDASAALAATVRPHIARLAAALGEAAGFAVPAGYSVSFLAQVESPNPVQVRDYSGLTVPMHVVPSGLVMMAEWPAAEITRYLRRPLPAFTLRTVTDPRALRERLARIRGEGSCWAHEEFAEGLSSVAAPVRDRNGRIIGAVHVHGPTYRFPPRGEADRIAAEVRLTARLLSGR
jgi:DNA-binding IclR family transcriptional regulator